MSRLVSRERVRTSERPVAEIHGLLTHAAGTRASPAGCGDGLMACLLARELSVAGSTVGSGRACWPVSELQSPALAAATRTRGSASRAFLAILPVVTRVGGGMRRVPPEEGQTMTDKIKRDARARAAATGESYTRARRPQARHTGGCPRCDEGRALRADLPGQERGLEHARQRWLRPGRDHRPARRTARRRLRLRANRRRCAHRPERSDLYRQAFSALARAGNRYRIRQVFGSRRHGGGDHLGSGVAALLVFKDGQPVDVYPRQAGHGYETIRAYLDTLG